MNKDTFTIDQNAVYYKGKTLGWWGAYSPNGGTTWHSYVRIVGNTINHSEVAVGDNHTVLSKAREFCFDYIKEHNFEFFLWTQTYLAPSS